MSEVEKTHEELVQEVYRMVQMLTYEEQQRIKDKIEQGAYKAEVEQ